MIVKPRLSCDGCIRPVGRRLALFKINDEYECYAESYVKCFWGLCSLHESVDKLSTLSVVPNTLNRVVIEQPRTQKMPYQQPNNIRKIGVKN